MNFITLLFMFLSIYITQCYIRVRLGNIYWLHSWCISVKSSHLSRNPCDQKVCARMMDFLCWFHSVGHMDLSHQPIESGLVWKRLLCELHLIATLLTLDHGLDNSLPAHVVAILFICLFGYWDIVRKFCWNSLHGMCQIWSTSYPHYCFRILKRDQRHHCYHGIILFDWIALCLDQLSYVKFHSSYCIFNSLVMFA